MRSTGNKNVDKTMAEQWTFSYINIATMVEYFQQGVLIKIVHYNDIEEIYKYIENHLAAWKERLKVGLNIGDAPIEDLVAMDAFANAVYDHAKWNFTKEEVHSILTRHMANTVRVNSFNFFQKETPPEGVDEDGITRINHEKDPADQFPKREQITDLLKSQFISAKLNF